MKTILSDFLEVADIIEEIKENDWSWQPNEKITIHNAITNCGRTRDRDGDSDVGADDTQNGSQYD